MTFAFTFRSSKTNGQRTRAERFMTLTKKKRNEIVPLAGKLWSGYYTLAHFYTHTHTHTRQFFSCLDCSAEWASWRSFVLRDVLPFVVTLVHAADYCVKQLGAAKHRYGARHGDVSSAVAIESYLFYFFC